MEELKKPCVALKPQVADSCDIKRFFSLKCSTVCFCSYNLGSGVASIVVNGTFSDGKWHKVKAVR